MDLETVRWKTADELDNNEREFLRENKDKLNQEELDAFSEILRDPEEEIVETGETTDAETTGEEQETETTETKPEVQYLTKDEANEFVQKALADRDAAKKDADTGTAKEQIAKKEILKFFDDGYKAQDANEFANALLEKLTPLLVDNTVSKLGQMTTEQRQRFDAANVQLDNEYKDLAKKNGLPDLESDKGQEVNGAIAAIAAKYGMDNYYEAYELYSKLPTKFGGGLTDAQVEVNQKKEALKGQKKAASMVGKGSGDGGSKDRSSGPSREEIATLDLDTLLERAMS